MAPKAESGSALPNREAGFFGKELPTMRADWVTEIDCLRYRAFVLGKYKITPRIDCLTARLALKRVRKTYHNIPSVLVRRGGAKLEKPSTAVVNRQFHTQSPVKRR